MLLLAPLVHNAPRDITPANAMARGMFYKPEQVDAWNGLEPLNKRLLPKGDVEVRYWGGFAWGTYGVRIRRQSGKWSATRLVDAAGQPPKRFPAPKIGWPAFWAKAERLGIFTLPDDATIKDRRGYHRIFDGYSTLVEYQRDGAYRAYAYNNPQHQTEWRYAKPMSMLDEFMTSHFPHLGAM